MSSVQVRRVKDCELVRVGNEPWSVFRNGRCIETGFPNLNTARLWVIKVLLCVC